MRQITFIFTILFICISCKKDSDELTFTEKWWKSTYFYNYYIRFSENGSYIKELYSGSISNSLKIPWTTEEGRWELKDNKIIFTLLINDVPMYPIYTEIDTSNVDVFAIEGFSIFEGYFYHLDLNAVIRRWRVLEDSTDLPWALYSDNDTLLDESNLLTWEILKQTEDILELSIYDNIDKMIYDRNK